MNAFSTAVPLLQPQLLDFGNDDIKIIIHNTTHKFATDSKPSGEDVKVQPIFGSRTFVNGVEVQKLSFGLPFMRFVKGSRPKITYHNDTLFTFNIHYHGLNTDGSTDGVDAELMFGKSTKLGPIATFQLPTITNNQSTLWFHAHNMFLSMEIAYAGVIGMIQVVDCETAWLNRVFKYQDNQLLLQALDVDVDAEGRMTSANLPTDDNRSSFSMINGQCAVNWYSNEQVPFVNTLYHGVTQNVVKIDIVNSTVGWRVFSVGVCDEDRCIKPFYLVQTDGGLMNPVKLRKTNVSVAGRIGILVDLTCFKHRTAYLFFYNYDQTEVYASMPAFPAEPNNPTLLGTVPDLKASENPSVYPTPIPDPNQENQQGDSSLLSYPVVPLIPQVEQIVENGSIVLPKGFHNIKPFLKIEQKKRYRLKGILIGRVVKKIRKTVFGLENYKAFRSVLNTRGFEYDPKYNYLAFLNDKYFYNLPEQSVDLPTRNLFLFPETDTNAIQGGNPNGTTEYVDGANRLMVDLWNSKELDLDWALEQYQASPNAFKPPVLPTSKFRIFKTDDKYSNTAMISNDTLKVQVFAQQVMYGDFSQPPLALATVVFPATDPCKLMNVQQWIDLINATFQSSVINIEGQAMPISALLQCDWSFFPYALNYLYSKTVYVKSAVIKTSNSSNYWIRLSGRWPLVQIFGKPMSGDTLGDPASSSMAQLRTKNQAQLAKIRARSAEARGVELVEKAKVQVAQVKRDMAQHKKCDEFAQYGILDSEIQQFFPFYATNDGDVQLPIACMKRHAELIVGPAETYLGLYDGYFNANLKSFSVKLHSSEEWIYTNGDCADAHSLHFHLTQGFSFAQSNNTSPGLVSEKRLNAPLLYSRDIYQVGPQESISFRLYWAHYASDESTDVPNFKCLGGIGHCHLAPHFDVAMVFSYYVGA